MFREVIQAMETGVLAQIGLIAFIIAFILVVVRVLFYPKKEREEAKRMPIDEPPEIDPEVVKRN